MNKRIKAIAFEWNSSVLLQALEILTSQHGWEVPYCVAYGVEDELKKRWPNIVYHDSLCARFGRPAPGFSDLPWAGLDQPRAEQLGYQAWMAIKQMDRLEMMGGFEVHDRVLHLHRLVSYWTGVFQRLKPDVLLMPTAPHVVYDYVAYTVAKEQGIRTLMFEYITTEGLLVAIDGFEDGLPPLTEAYKRYLMNPHTEPVVLSERMEAYWLKLQGSHRDALNRVAQHFLANGERVRQMQAEEKRVVQEAEALAAKSAVAAPETVLDRVLMRFGFERNRPQSVSQPVLPPRAPPSTVEGHHAGRFYYWTETPDDLAYRAQQYRRDRHAAIRSRYEELAVMPDLAKPYIYVALHYQPERATNPNGGAFEDQSTVIGMLAATLPRGWHIYVKEHPSQFAVHAATERGRWTTLYDAIVAYPNVEFVTMETSPFDLIDNAKAVATITGTTSWEALVRGTPTLIFGEAWYKGCPGCYSVRTLDDCRNALSDIAAGKQYSLEEVRRFLWVAEQTSFLGYLGPDDLPEGLDEATVAQRLADAIVERYADSSGRMRALGDTALRGRQSASSRLAKS